MTREQFIELHRHELGGMILDAMQQRDGAHAAMFARMILKKVDVRLGVIYDCLLPAKPLPVKPESHAGSATTPGPGVRKG